jgi:hypothetical protein
LPFAVPFAAALAAALVLALIWPAAAFALGGDAFRSGRFLLFALARERFRLAIGQATLGGTTVFKSTVEQSGASAELRSAENAEA